VSPAQELLVWLYERPRLRRAWMVVCTLWFGSVWTLVTAPTAAADWGGGMMSWTGLRDTYGVPVSDYVVSVVSPVQAAAHTWQTSFSFDPSSWAPAVLSTVNSALSNAMAAGFLALESSFLVFMGAAGIWFLKFALSAPWLSWLATLADPIVHSINVLVDQLYVMPIALLVCIGVGGVIALTKGVGRGLGIIVGGLLVIFLAYWLLRDPVQDLVGPNGVLGIGQSLGFMVAEGAVHNGPLASGGSGAQLSALTSLLCDVLLREPIQLINFGTVIDDNPACAGAWSAAVMTGQLSAPANAMAFCNPAALAYADQMGLGTAGWFLVVLFVELVVLLALVYIGFQVVLIGFKTFTKVLVLVVAAPLAVAPGPPRRFAVSTATTVVKDGVKMLVTTAGLGVVAIVDVEVTSGTVPGVTGMSHPIAKLMVLLVVTVAFAIAYHQMLASLDNRRHDQGLLHRIGEFGRDLQSLDYLTVNATGGSMSGWLRRRWYHDPKSSDLWAGPDSDYSPSNDRAQPVYIVPEPDAPGRTAPMPGDRGGGGPGRSGGDDGTGGLHHPHGGSGHGGAPSAGDGRGGAPARGAAAAAGPRVGAGAGRASATPGAPARGPGAASPGGPGGAPGVVPRLPGALADIPAVIPPV
jgi:hypothetical protein